MYSYRFELFLVSMLLFLLSCCSKAEKSNKDPNVEPWWVKEHRRRRLVEKWQWGYENDSFPFGHNATDRIAIILTGQLRSANRTFNSGTLIQNMHLKMFSEADPPSVSATIVEWLFKPLARKHPVDVFMYLTAHPEQNNSNWDGSPHNYEPEVGDTRGCEIFSNNDVFKNTGNRFFCLVEPEVQLLNQWTAHYTMWGRYYTAVGPPPHMKEQAAQQLYAMYRANTAAKQFAMAMGYTYKYKIRLRPDTAFLHPFPDLSKLNFDGRNEYTQGTIYYANKRVYRNGNEDWFNIGKAENMDHLLDRYNDLLTLPWLDSSQKSWYTLEDILVGTMGKRYGIAMAYHDEIWMVVIRVAYHAINSWIPPVNKLVWKELSYDNSTNTRRLGTAESIDKNVTARSTN